MIFSSYAFIFIFLPAALAGFFLVRLTRRAVPVKCFLILASLVFYSVGEPRFALLLLASVAVNRLLLSGFLPARGIFARRLCFLLTVLWNLGLLFVFKYLNFFRDTIAMLAGKTVLPVDILLPLGISFYTFQILAYAVDVYKGNQKPAGVLDYALFVTFFPQLIVGPIVSGTEMLPQIEGDALLAPRSGEDAARGVTLFCFGCAKKILLADALTGFAKDYYSLSPDALAASGSGYTAAALLAFAFAYYFDFSGYIDMARGIALMFGIRLPENFNSPYRAVDFSDFWRRWNITVSRFFYKTVYDRVFRFGDGVPRLALAALLTFTVSGLWHGADWHYIAWGAANGFFVLLSALCVIYIGRPPKYIGIPVTFVLSVLLRVPFDANGLSQSSAVYRALFSGNFFSSLSRAFSAFPAAVILIPVCAVLCFLPWNTNRLTCSRITAGTACSAALLLVLSLMFMSQVSTFLYFNF